MTESLFLKIIFFFKFHMFRQGSSFIASFVEQLVCSKSKMYSILIAVFFLWIDCNKSKGRLQKSILLKILGDSLKKQWYCFVCGAPYISYFWNVKCADSSDFISVSQRLPKMYVSKWFILEMLGASWKKQWYCFFRRAPCI